MAAAFIYKSSLLHDHEQHKKIQPEGKESRPQVGRACFLGKFPDMIYPSGVCLMLLEQSFI